MSIAAKYKKKAAELELQKQFDKAVAMYVRAIEAGDAEGAEVDVTVLNKVGDLTLRLGRVGEAVSSYERAVEHYTTVGLFNNAIALCNKILRHAPGRAGIYLTLGRVCARKGMRGDATRNFLEYASRMKQEGRTDEAMRSLAEVAGLMPELDEVRRLVEEHAERVGIALPAAAASEDGSVDVASRRDSLVFLDIDYDAPVAVTPPIGASPIPAPRMPLSAPTVTPAETPRTSSLDDLLIFDPLADDALSEESASLEGLETRPDDTMAHEVPSLLAPMEPTVPDEPPPIADGLTDALGFDVGAAADANALPLDGLVSEVDDPVSEVVRPSDDTPAVDASVDDVPEAASATADGAPEASSAPADDDEVAFSAPEQTLETLTPYDGVAAITPSADEALQPVELDTLSPYDGIETVPSPMLGSEALHELDTLSPYDGVDVVTPPSVEDMPPLTAEAIDEGSLEVSLDASNERHEVVEATETIAGREEAVELELSLDAIDQLDVSADAADALDASRDVGDVLDLSLEAADDLALSTDAFDALDVPLDGSLVVPLDGIVDGSSDVPLNVPLDSIVDVPLDSIVDVPLDGIVDVPLDAIDELDHAPELEQDHATSRPALDELVLSPDPDELTKPHGIDTLDALPESVTEIEDARDIVIADLLMSEPLPPAHSTRPARPIPRLDPHDFILPGELPPLVLPDEWLGIAASALLPSPEVPDFLGPVPDAGDVGEVGEVPDAPVVLDELLVSDESEVRHEPVVPDEWPLDELANAFDAPTIERVPPTSTDAPEVAPLSGAPAPDDAVATPAQALDPVDDLDELDAAFTPTPSSAPFNLALDRCARLRDEVDAHPGDWARRRRLAEALIEAGERSSGLDELAATALGLELEGALPEAVRVLDDLVRVAPEQVAYHQKRVELAVRLGDRDRLRESYLDLADALVRSGHAVRAEPVYVRVLELDPWDDRARAALGDAAPPPPSQKPSAAPADDGYVNLADWLADDAAPRDTRMRVKEPTVTGDEDADFDQLLQNFREGVARSLGEDDYESHYDLGVAYKEMGLLDDAVAEFQRALRSPTHRLPAYEALGQCFLEQGSFPVAVTVLSRALHEPGLDDEQRVGVLYLLGYACEALQRRDEARSYYQRVYATDIHFRDVAERLTALDGSAR